jgi:hypothetical protein
MHRPFLACAISFVVAVGCGCMGKGAAKGALPPDLTIEAPADLVGELELGDPQSAIDRLGATAGVQSFWDKWIADLQNPAFRRLYPTVDLHATSLPLICSTPRRRRLWWTKTWPAEKRAYTRMRPARGGMST